MSFRLRTSLLLGGLACTCVLAALPLAAQELRGTVRDSTSRQPIGGAVVQLLDSAGNTLARHITNDRGQYRLRWIGVPKRVRVVRLGFRPRVATVPAVVEGIATLDLLIAAIPTLLESVLVSDDTHCSARKDRAAAMGLWEQTRAGLLATVVSREANPAKLMIRLRFERIMEGNSDRTRSLAVYADTTDSASTTFAAVHTAAEFVRRGFMDDSAGVRSFSAPDAEVLMDEAFANGYCFHLMDPQRSRPNQVGLAFRPADRKRGPPDPDVKFRVDVEGAVWIDTVARALRDIEFRYLGMDQVDRAAEALRIGGRVNFREMPNGIVLVEHFFLRLPRRNMLSLPGATRIVTGGEVNAAESGGALATAVWPDGTSWNAPLGALRAQALTNKGLPAAGIKVSLTDTDFRGTADSSGIIQIGGLFPGPYQLHVIDPRAAKLGITLPTTVKFTAVRDSVSKAQFVVPTLDQFIVDRCKALDQFAVGDSTRVLGRVMTPGGKPVPLSELTFTLTDTLDVTRPIKDTFTTGLDGVFQLCNKNVHLGMTLAISVKRFFKEPPVEALRITLTDKLTLVRILAGDK